MTDLATIASFVPGAAPVELVSYYPEFDWYYPRCELETKFWFVRNVQPDWTIFDIGANVGVYSVLFSRLAKQGRVVAFEPTTTAEMLRRNLDHNRCTNVQVEEVALGSKTGEIVDDVYRIWGEAAETRAYPFVRLDDYIRNNNIERLDCLKIDVDSFDFEVLMGARETLKRLKPTVVVELNHALSRRGQSNAQAFKWLAELGIEEVMCLDEENFVVTPGRRPSETYPTGASLTMTFASHADMPQDEQSPLCVLQTLDTHIAAAVHGATRTQLLPRIGAFEIETPPVQWSYAVSLPAQFDLPNDPDLRVLIELEVLQGRIGAGCLGDDGQYLGPERMLGAGSRKAVLLPIPNAQRLHEIIVRNVSAEGASRVRIYGVQIGRLPPTEAERTLSAHTLLQRVAQAEEAEGRSAGAPQGGAPAGEIEIVDLAGLQQALGASEPFGNETGAQTPLAFWRMEQNDAPIFAYAYRARRPSRHLEFGTWEGFGARLCAENSDAEIWTLNLPEGEQQEDGRAAYASLVDGDVVQTDRGEFVGRLYREAGFGKRVHQILADSTAWRPDMVPGFFDTVLIDGGHTEDVVVSDTETALRLTRKGGLIMWHDFCPDEVALQAHAAPRGVVRAVAANLERWRPQMQRLFWVRPSWILMGIKA